MPEHPGFQVYDHTPSRAFCRQTTATPGFAPLVGFTREQNAGLASRARGNGAPGPCPHYHPLDDGTFVPDPDGRSIEAVCHNPQG